jgi:hypothetical protein
MAKITAALVPVSSNVRGSVDLDRSAEPNKFRVRIQLRGAAVGAQHGWQIRSGRCGESSPPVGSSAAYPSIPVRADGTADVRMTISLMLDASQQYIAVLYAGPTEIDGTIACGNITSRD